MLTVFLQGMVGMLIRSPYGRGMCYDTFKNTVATGYRGHTSKNFEIGTIHTSYVALLGTFYDFLPCMEL